MSLIRGNALAIPLADESVDLIVTSPPYFALRSYTDGGEHYDGQIGSEATPADFIAALVEVTRECVRTLKPSGSLWVNLGDSYMGSGGHNNKGIGAKEGRGPKSYGWSGRGRGTDGTEPDWTEANAAWMAGVIDSDGSISVHINKQKEGNAPSFVPWVRIGQVTPEAVHEAHRITGTGRVFQDGRGVWNWNASAQQTGYVLERVWPYLRIKQRQALAAIELCRTIREYGASGGRKLGSDEIAYRQRIRDAVLGWNGGDPTGWEPPRVAKLALPQHSQWKPKAKSLNGLPWRYALGCIDDLGLILRAEVVWSKPNGLPESVQDRVRRSHENWFHFTKEPRYFSAVDEIREGYRDADYAANGKTAGGNTYADVSTNGYDRSEAHTPNPLGKLPGSVWTIDSQLWLDGPIAFCPRCGRDLRGAGSGPGGSTPKATATTGSRVTGSAGSTESPTSSGSARSVKDSPSTTSAGSATASTRTTSKRSRSGSTSSGVTPPQPGTEPRPLASTGTTSPTPTPTSEATDGESAACVCETGCVVGGQGSVWQIPTEPLRVPDHLPQHFAAFPSEWPRRIILGWSPSGICVECGQGRRPVVDTGYACACPTPDAPTRPAVVLDVFCGTGTTVAVANALGRHGVGVDLSADYLRVARWRCQDPGLRAKVLGVDKPKPEVVGQLDLLGGAA